MDVEHSSATNFLPNVFSITGPGPRKTIQWKQIATLVPQEDLRKLKENDTVTVNLAGSGLAEHSDLLTLHVREARVDLWEHLAETKKRVSFVSGAPGIGMSMDVYAYALWEAHTHHKRVLYVHGGDDEYSIVLVSAGTNNMRFVNGVMDENDKDFLLDTIVPFLEQREVDIVVLDGQISSVIESVFARMLEFRDVRMISCTPYDIASGYLYSDEKMETVPDFSFFVMDSWTKEDYDAAIVSGALVLNSPTLTVDEMLYYAGGSIRMIQWSVERVITELIPKLKKSYMDLLIGYGGLYQSNSLIAIYRDQRIVLSKFVAMMLLNTFTGSVVETARKVLYKDPPRMDWPDLALVLEVLFLARERPSVLFRNVSGRIEEWPRLRPDSSLPLPTFSSASDPCLSDSQQDWLVPDRYTHDSFDAIYRVSLDTARLIKCTVFGRHSCNLKYLIPFVKAMNVHVVELVYVCPSYNLDYFKVPTPELKPKGRAKKNSEYQQYMDLKDTITKIWHAKCSSNDGSSYPDPAIIIRHVTYQQKDSDLPIQKSHPSLSQFRR